MNREHEDKIKKDLQMVGIISGDSFGEFLCSHLVQEREGIETGLDNAGIEAGLRRLAELARGKVNV